MSEVFLDPAGASRAGRSLASSAVRPSSRDLAAEAPWGADEAGAAFSALYGPAASAALAVWSATAAALERLGTGVSVAASSMVDADDRSSTRLGGRP